MKAVFRLLALLLLLTACEHKELCFYHPHGISVKVEFDWKDAPGAMPRGMCVYFYSMEEGSYRRFDFSNTQGGTVDLRVGKYRILCFNNDTECIYFYNTDSYYSYGFSTREGNVLEPIFGNAANFAPRAAGTDDERVFISPDMMWGCSVEEVEITDEGIFYSSNSYDEEGRSVTDSRFSSNNVITLFPHELVCIYTYEVRNVKNLKHMSQMCGSISGMSGYLTMSTEELDTECVTIPFEARKADNSTVVGSFHTFGHHTENAAPHKMVFYVVMDDGAKYCFKDFKQLDVTEQVDTATDRRHIHLIIDGIDLPQPIENGHGFKPSFDDWDVIESDIIL